jgi:uncharacterized protein YdbL (DUF1318 family)
MTDPLGVAEVQVTADVAAALDAIAKVQSALEALAEAANIHVNINGGGDIPKGEQNRQYSAADIARYAQGMVPRGSDVGSIKGTAEIDIDADSIAAQVKEAIEGQTYSIKIELDTQQIQTQLRNLVIPVQFQQQGGNGAPVASSPAVPMAKPPAAAIKFVNDKGGDAGIDREFLQQAADLASAMSGQRHSVPPGDLHSSDVVRLLTQYGMAMGAAPGSGFKSYTTTGNRFLSEKGQVYSGPLDRMVKVATAGGYNKDDAQTELQEVAPTIHKLMQKVTPTYVGSAQPAAPAPVQQVVQQQQQQYVQQQPVQTTQAPPGQPQPAYTPILPPRGPLQGLTQEMAAKVEAYVLEAEAARVAAGQAMEETPVPSVDTDWLLQQIGDRRREGSRASRSGGTIARHGEITDYDAMGRPVSASKRRSGGARPLVGPMSMLGRNAEGKELEIDVTDIGEMAAAGVFHGWNVSKETGELIPRPIGEDGNYVNVQSQVVGTYDAEGNLIGQRRHAVDKMSPGQLLQRALSARLRREIGTDEFQAITRRSAEGKTADEAGATTGYFASPMAYGANVRKALGPLSAGHQGFMRPSMHPEEDAARDWLEMTGGSGVPLGSATLRPEEFMTPEQSADYAKYDKNLGIRQRARQLREQLRSGRPDALTIDELLKNRGQQAGFDSTGSAGPEFMAELSGLFEAILDPNLLPTTASEDFGKFNAGESFGDPGKGGRGTGAVWNSLEYQMGRILAATGLLPALGFDKTQPVTFKMMRDAIRNQQGGFIPAAMLDAIAKERFEKVGLAFDKADQMGSTENAAVTRETKAAKLEGAPTLGYKDRRDKAERELAEAKKEQKLIQSRAMGRLAPRTATAMANAQRDDRAGLSALPEASEFETGKTEEEVKAAVAEAIKGDIDKAKAAEEDAANRVTQERQVERVTGSIVDKLREAGDEGIYDIPSLLQKVTAPLEEGGLFGRNFNTLADPAGEQLMPGVLDKAIGDIVQGQYTQRGKSAIHVRPASRTMGEAYTVPIQRKGLNRGATELHDVGGVVNYIDPQTGDVVPREEIKRRQATRYDTSKSTKSALTDPTEFQAKAAAAGGFIPPIGETLRAEKQAKDLSRAQEMAETITPGAQAMVVTIGGPLPLPVTIAGGSMGPGGPGGPGKRGIGGHDDDSRRENAREAAAAAKVKEPPPYTPDPRKDVIFVSPGGRLGRTPSPTEVYDQNIGRSMPYRPGTGKEDQVFRRATGEINMPGVRLPALQHATPPPLPGIQYDNPLLLPAQAADARSRGARPLDTLGNAQRPVAAFGQESGVVLEQRDRDLRMKQEAKDRTEAERQDEREAREKEAKAKAEAAKAGKPGEQKTKSDAERLALKARAPSESRLDQLLRSAGSALPVPEFDTAVYEEQEFQRAQQGARASLRQARGKLPQRALSTSIVQIAENLFGGIEKPLAKIAQAEQEFTQLGQIGRQRGRVDADLQLQRIRRDVIGETIQREKAAPEADRTLSLKQIEELEIGFESLTDEIDLNERSLKKLTELEDEQSKKVTDLAESAVGASDVLRNLGAGFVGGVGGALVTQLVSQVAGAVMQGFQLAMPTLDRALGGANVAGRVQTGLAQAYTQGGYSQTAIRETLAQAGLTSETMARFEGTVNANAEAVALANQMDDARNLIFTEQAVTGQMGSSGLLPAYYQQVGGVSLPNPLGGRFEWGGSDSPAKVFAGMINDAAQKVDKELGFSQSDVGIAQNAYDTVRTEQLGMPKESRLTEDQMWERAQKMVGLPEGAWLAARGEGDTTTDRIEEAINSQLGDKFSVEGGLNQDQYASFRALGGQAGDLAAALEKNNLILTENGKPVTVDRLGEALNAATGGGQGNIDVESMARAMGSDIGFKNELWAMAQGQARAVQMREMDFAMQGMGHPVLTAGQARAPMSVGGDVRGLSGGGSFAGQYQSLASDVRAFERQGEEMLTSLMPDKVNEEYRNLGRALQDLQAESQAISRTQAWRQYEMAIKQARYQVEDLQALTGQGAGSEIGALERQNMLLQRRLQLLQFEQQQRSINFQVAVAGFQSAGLTGEERSARLDIARREAEIQQKMLNINKQMFNNQVTIVDQSNLRQLELATMNLRNVAASFRENSRLSEIGTLSELIGRRQKQVEAQYNEQKQFWAQADEALTQFTKDLGNRTKTLANQVDVQVEGTVTFQQALGQMMEQNDRLQQLIEKGTSPGLIVRDIHISPQAQTIVGYHQLVTMIADRIGEIFDLVGGNNSNS